MQNALNQMALVCQSFLSWCSSIITSLMSNDIILIILGFVLFIFMIYFVFSLIGEICSLFSFPGFFHKSKDLDNINRKGDK